jgi:hypothetical protein
MPSKQLSKGKLNKVFVFKTMASEYLKRCCLQVFELGHAFKTIEQGQTEKIVCLQDNGKCLSKDKHIIK